MDRENRKTLQASQESLLEAAIGQARSLGHKMSQAYDNGTDIMLSQCIKCKRIAAATENVASGTAIYNECTGPIPTNEDRERGKQLLLEELRTQNAQERAARNKPRQFNPPPSQAAYCEHCGNATTLVGVSCRKCAEARGLTERQSRRPPTVQWKRHATLGTVPVVSAVKHFNERRWTFSSYKRASDTAPCGTASSVISIYLPADWQPDADTEAAPDRLIAYPCHSDCCIIKYAKR